MAHQNAKALLKKVLKKALHKLEKEAEEPDESFVEIEELDLEEIEQDECDAFVNITDTEAQGIKVEERSDLYYQKITDGSAASFGMNIMRASATTAGSFAKSLGKKAHKALLPKKDPSPEELHCPCWSHPEDGWKYCFVDSHVRAAIKKLGARK